MNYVQHITVWIISFNPSDFPGLYVVRPHLVGSGWTIPAQFCATFKNIHDARAYVPKPCTYMERDPRDDAVIVESWVEWWPQERNQP